MRIEGNVRLKDMGIEWRNEATYLGVTMDKKLTWGSHIEYARQKARATRAKLYSITSRTSKLALWNKVPFIKSVLQPHLTYASATWGYATKRHLKKPQACAQDNGGRPLVRQKRRQTARFEDHHRNGKDQTDRSEDIPKKRRAAKISYCEKQ